MPSVRKSDDREQMRAGFELAIALLGPAAVEMLKAKAEKEEDPEKRVRLQSAIGIAKWASAHPKTAARGGEALVDMFQKIDKKGR
jgi:hypothetical protein